MLDGVVFENGRDAFLGLTREQIPLCNYSTSVSENAVLGAFGRAEQLYWTSTTASGAIILPVHVGEGALCQVIELLWNLFACDLFVKARTGRHGIRHAQLAIAHAVKHHFM